MRGLRAALVPPVSALNMQRWTLSVGFATAIMAWAGATPPHILLVVANSLGYFDTSLLGGSISTPTIDAFCKNGLLLYNHYAECLTTASRAALLTGFYPIHLGLQKGQLMPGQPSGLPLNVSTIADHLSRIGYECHMVGAWALGFATKEYTPTYRGFQTHFGSWQLGTDYWTHAKYAADLQNSYGIDFHDGLQPIWNAAGQYAEDIYDAVLADTLANRNKSRPFCGYYGHQLVGSGGQLRPMTSPGFLLAPSAPNARQQYGSMVAALDNSFAHTIDALKKEEMLNNTIIIFLSDTGGPVQMTGGVAASNWPLRGGMGTTWEGGIRTLACAQGPGLPRATVSYQLLHISDWLPTLYAAAGGNASEIGGDGVNQWTPLTTKSSSARNSIFHNGDPAAMTAFRFGDFKVVAAANSDWKYLSGWFAPTAENKTHLALSTGTDMFAISGIFNTVAYSESVLPGVRCGRPGANYESSCNLSLAPCLFNVRIDPCEYKNLAFTNQSGLEQLWKMLLQVNATSRNPVEEGNDLRAAPRFNHGVWSTWRDFSPILSINCTAACYIEQKRCNSIPQVANSLWNASTFTVGSSVTYVCSTGFEMQGQSVVYCRNNYTWSALPQCTPA